MRGWRTAVAMCAATLVLGLGCGGGDATAAKGKAKGKGKGKSPAVVKEDTESPAAKAAGALGQWHDAHPEDAAGFAAEAAKAKKLTAGTPHAKEVDEMIATVLEFRKNVCRQGLEKIKGESGDPANEAHPERYLERLAKLEKEAPGVGADVAAELAPGIAKLRVKLLTKVYAKEVKGYEVSHREDVDGILKRIEEFRPKLEGTGDAGAPLKEALEADVAKLAERREWITRAPAAGEVDLLTAAAKGGWKTLGAVEMSQEDGVLTIKGTGEGKAFGVVYAAHAWWKDLDADLEFTIVSGGFQLVAHFLPPSAGFSQAVSSRTFGTDKPVHLTLKVVDDTATIGGDADLPGQPSKSMPPAGGLGFYIFPGSQVKFTSVKITAR